MLVEKHLQMLLQMFMKSLCLFTVFIGFFLTSRLSNGSEKSEDITSADWHSIFEHFPYMYILTQFIETLLKIYKTIENNYVWTIKHHQLINKILCVTMVNFYVRS